MVGTERLLHHALGRQASLRMQRQQYQVSLSGLQRVSQAPCPILSPLHPQPSLTFLDSFSTPLRPATPCPFHPVPVRSCLFLPISAGSCPVLHGSVGSCRVGSCSAPPHPVWFLSRRAAPFPRLAIPSPVCPGLTPSFPTLPCPSTSCPVSSYFVLPRSVPSGPVQSYSALPFLAPHP